MRAHSAAGFGEGVGFVEQAKAVFEIAFAYRFYIAGDVHVGGAGGDADAAGYTAVGFLLRLPAGVALDKFEKGFDGIDGRCFGHFDPFFLQEAIALSPRVPERRLVPGFAVDARCEAVDFGIAVYP